MGCTLLGSHTTVKGPLWARKRLFLPENSIFDIIINFFLNFSFSSHASNWAASCIRYHKPISISFLTVGAIMLMTLSVLYWNYYETVHRRMTKKHGLVLDHWGKERPTELETMMLAGGHSFVQLGKTCRQHFPIKIQRI